MPDNDKPLFDYHEHHDPAHHPITHSHDDHPRHHHDHGGSVIYDVDIRLSADSDPAILVELHVDHGGTNATWNRDDPDIDGPGDGSGGGTYRTR